jgi:ComF family protein
MFRWLFQQNCRLCEKRANEIVCKACQTELEHLRYQAPKFGTPDLPVYAWGVYEGVLKQMIRLLKYNAQPELGDWLGEQLGRWWLTTQIRASDWWVAAVPLSQERLKKRGYNQAERIALAFCQRTGLHYWDGLVRTRSTVALHGFTPEERSEILQNAFRTTRSLKNRRILLIDDILTTGTTLQLCADALKAAGCIQVEGLVVAHPKFLKSDSLQSYGQNQWPKIAKRHGLQNT